MNQYPPGGPPGQGGYPPGQGYPPPGYPPGYPGAGPPLPPLGAPPGTGARTDMLAVLAVLVGGGGSLVTFAGLLSISMVCCSGWFGSAMMLVCGGTGALGSAAGMLLGLQSHKRQSLDPTLVGRGWANTGVVLGIVSLLFSVVVIVLGAMALFLAAASAAGG